MIRLIFFTIVIAVIASAGQGGADIYRFDGEDEIVYFSDSPNDKRYQLVLKEQLSRAAGRARGKTLPVAKRSAGSPGEPGSSSYDRALPIDGIITSKTGLRTDPFNGKLTHHNGLDIAAPSGTPVKPVAPGTVIFSGWKGGYGNTVVLDHHDGMVTVYAHHSSNSVREGDSVGLNSVIAHTGSTGRSTGPHLHFEAWRSGNNITADFMPGSSHAQPPTVLANAPIRRLLQDDGTILFTNLR